MTISEIKIKNNVVIKITKDTVNGITFGQLRIWELDKNSYRFLPTRKGIGFELKHINQIINSLLMLYHTESNICGDS